MTTWTTFETIDQTPRFTEFYVDRLGNFQRVENERTRFIFAVAPKPDMSTVWSVMDLQAEDDQERFATGTMRECVQWMAGRVLYGA